MVSKAFCSVGKTWGSNIIRTTDRDLPGLKFAFLSESIRNRHGLVLEVGCSGEDICVTMCRLTIDHGWEANLKLPLRQGFADIITLFDLARRYNAVALFSAISTLAIIPATAILLWVFYEAIFHHFLHEGYALLGVMLLLVAGQGFTVATLSLQLRRLERRFSKRI
jgi:hypothetical protein